MPVPPDPPRSAPRWTHSFSARFRSVWREFGNKTFLNYYGTLPVSFVYSLLSAPRGTWSEIWFFLSFCDRLATAMSDIESDPQFTVLLDDLEASGAENSDSYSDISVTSVYTCDLTDWRRFFGQWQWQVCPIEMSTGVAAVRHRSGLGLTFIRISHIKD